MLSLILPNEETKCLTKVIVAQCLDNLRNKKERQVYGVLHENTMGILKDERIVIESPLE